MRTTCPSADQDTAPGLISRQAWQGQEKGPGPQGRWPCKAAPAPGQDVNLLPRWVAWNAAQWGRSPCGRAQCHGPMGSFRAEQPARSHLTADREQRSPLCASRDHRPFRSSETHVPCWYPQTARCASPPPCGPAPRASRAPCGLPALCSWTHLLLLSAPLPVTPPFLLTQGSQLKDCYSRDPQAATAPTTGGALLSSLLGTPSATHTGSIRKFHNIHPKTKIAKASRRGKQTHVKKTSL